MDAAKSTCVTASFHGLCQDAATTAANATATATCASQSKGNGKVYRIGSKWFWWSCCVW